MAEEPQRSQIELQEINNVLRSENGTLHFEIDSLRSLNATLVGQIEALTTKISELEKRLGRNSSNSSLSPSSDLFGRKMTPESPNRKARRALGKKQGKQPGSEGKHLAQRVDPDEVINHIPTACANCKADLIDAPIESIESRQLCSNIVISSSRKIWNSRRSCSVSLQFSISERQLRSTPIRSASCSWVKPTDRRA